MWLTSQVEWSKKKKWKTKIYRHHTGYIGNLKEIPAWRVREQHPERIIARAVKVRFFVPWQASP